MKFKFKAMFVAIVTLVDVMVILLVVMSNDNTNIKNDVSTKTAAHIISNTKIQTEENENIKEIPTSEEISDEENLIEEKQEEKTDEIIETTNVTEEPVVQIDNNISYDEMTMEEKENALYAGTLPLEYSGLYTNSPERLSPSKGAIANFNGHKETYYSERVLPGTSLNIPGRHVADDGTVRDGDGYICVAANSEYMPKGSILITSLGPAKVYDSVRAVGTIDIYVNW